MLGLGPDMLIQGHIGLVEDLARDIEFLIGYARTLSNADNYNVGVAGFSIFNLNEI